MAGRHEDRDGDGVADYATANPYRASTDASATAHTLTAHAASGLTGGLIHSALAAMGAVGGQIVSDDALAAGALDALRQAPAGLTAAGAAGFLATCAEESAHFRTTVEYGSGQRYAPYIGRTFIQLTWSSNYLGFGQWCKAKGLVSDVNVFVNNPASLSDLKWAWLGPVYYMETHGLWPYANRGDFLGLSQAVNGGNGRIGTSFTPNGWAERQKAYKAFLAAGASLLPGTTTPTPAKRKVLPDMPERAVPAGSSGHRIVCPTGSASSVVARAWLSASFDGNANVEVWAQKSGGAAPAGAGNDAAAHRSWVIRPGDRPWVELPSGTEFVTVHVTGATGPGSLAIEQQPA